MERVAITGATGFVGRYVVKELLNRGYQVYAFVRNVKKLKEVFPQGVDALEVDFSDKDSLRKALEKAQPHYVIHLIGILVEDRRSGSTFQRVHYLYAKNLYEALRELSPKRVVHMGSLGTHKDAPSLYHQTKFMAEEFLKTSGLNYTILRPSIILGPEQKLFADMWNITKYLRVVALPGGGGYLFQPVDVRDVACAFVSAMEKEEAINKTYELCGPDRVSFKELLEDIFSRWDRKVLLLPVPKVFMYVAGKVAERVLSPPPFSSDQMLMMWRDNICGLDEDVEPEGVRKLCNKEPIPYKESLEWSLREFAKRMV
jgi:Predicted nucleoside-diphosphate-sugar epimerases